MRHLLPGERPFPHRATSSHPQLRDLLHLLPPVDGQQRLLTTCHSSIRYATPAHEPMQRLLPLPYCPTALSTGNGIVVVGGRAGQLSLRMNSASGLDPMTTWSAAALPRAQLTRLPQDQRCRAAERVHRQFHLGRPHSRLDGPLPAARLQQ